MEEGNYRKVKTILWVIMLANILVAALKMIIGVKCGCKSVLADGVHSIADGASNVVGLIGIRLASKPVDKKHPYGHGKFEIIASLFIGIMLAYMGVRLIAGTIGSFFSPPKVSVDMAEIIVIVLTVIINVIVASYEYRCGKALDSTILITDSLHTRGDIFISCSVLAGILIISLFKLYIIDAAISALVAVAVLISAWQIIRNCIDVLVDSAVVDDEEIKTMLMTIPGIYDIHKVKSRGNLSNMFVELHVIIDRDEDIVFAHNLSHKIESLLKRSFGPQTGVSVHVEPDDGRGAAKNNKSDI